MNEQVRSFDRDFDAMVTIYGDRTALVPAFERQRSLSYYQLDRLVRRHLAWFGTLGLRAGDRIGVLLPNSLELLAIFTACLRGGYGFAPLACDTSACEAQAWIALIQPARIIVGDILPDPVQAVLDASPTRRIAIETNGSFSYLPETDAVPRASAAAKIYLYTSGTTGRPKAIVIDGDRLWSSGYAYARHHMLGFDTPFRIWNYLPQSYLGGLFNLYLIPLSVAGSSVIDEPFSGRTFLGFWQTVDRYDISALWLVPTIVRGLLALGERTRRYETKSYRDAIRIAFLGTAPIELSTKQRFEELYGIRLLENYALSETTFLTSESRESVSGRVEGSVGAVLPYVDLRFRAVAAESDPSFREILVRTPFMFDGYLEAEGNLVREEQEGFFATGDLGYVDERGQLVVTGRCKDIIKKGGQFVSLREVELLAMRHPGVAYAAAVPVAHAFYGESYTLFVQPASRGAFPTVDNLRRFLYENLARHKWPEHVELVEAFPQTGSGKIRKFVLKQTGGL